MNKNECDNLNSMISEIAFLSEGLYLSSFLIQPHIFHVTAMQKESELQEHTHQTFEISIILEGRISYYINSDEVTLKEGDMVIIPPKNKHYWKLHDPNTVVCSSMAFISGRGSRPRQQIKKLLTSIEKHKFKITSFSKYEDCVQNMLEILINPVVFYEEELRKLQELSYIYVFRKLLPNWQYPDIPSNRPGRAVTQSETIDLIKYYIFDNLSRPIKMADLRRHLGLSEDHLNRLFKQSEHISIGQFITRIKLEKASKMLVASNHDIKTIAYENGYFDVNYFCSVFKKHIGQTPSEFRRKNRNHEL
jgi:AraC-like DNA-binding protein